MTGDRGEWLTFGADYRLGHNPVHSCTQVWRDLRSHRWQTWMVFRSEFAATFRRTAAGMVWAFIMPIIPVLAFLLLLVLRVFPSHGEIHPVGYVAVGMTLWLYLYGLVMAPAQAVSKYREVLKSSDFPMIAIFVASYGQLAFDMLVRLALVIPVMLVIQGVSPQGLALLVVLIVPATAFGVAAGILLALVGAVLEDVRNIVEIVFRYLVFVSFAIFPIPLGDATGWLYTLNPFAIFIDNIRNVLLLGDFASPTAFAVTGAGSFVFLAAALHFYYILERRIAGAL